MLQKTQVYCRPDLYKIHTALKCVHEMLRVRDINFAVCVSVNLPNVEVNSLSHSQLTSLFINFKFNILQQTNGFFVLCYMPDDSLMSLLSVHMFSLEIEPNLVSYYKDHLFITGNFSLRTQKTPPRSCFAGTKD